WGRGKDFRFGICDWDSGLGDLCWVIAVLRTKYSVLSTWYEGCNKRLSWSPPHPDAPRGFIIRRDITGAAIHIAEQSTGKKPVPPAAKSTFQMTPTIWRSSSVVALSS